MQLIDIENFVRDLFQKENTSHLPYHNLEHTLAVTDTVGKMCLSENISAINTFYVKLAAYLHDTGYLYTYHNHEDKGIELAQKWMTAWNFDNKAIETVSALIEATKLSHQPQSQLESIIADADLAYGVTDCFFETGPLLRKEWVLNLNKTYTEPEWEELQLNFLNKVEFYSDYGKIHFQKITTANIKKQQLRVSALKKE